MIQYYQDLDVLKGMCAHYGKEHLIPIVEAWAKPCSDGAFLTSPVLMGLCLYGEARGEDEDGQNAVLQVIINRAIERDKQYVEPVLLRKLQFSCFNPGDRSLREAIDVSEEEIISYCEKAGNMLNLQNTGHNESVIGRATIYLTEQALILQVKRWADKRPGAWDFNRLYPMGKVGAHYFFGE